jgi:hypothetical protein
VVLRLGSEGDLGEEGGFDDLGRQPLGGRGLDDVQVDALDGVAQLAAALEVAVGVAGGRDVGVQPGLDVEAFLSGDRVDLDAGLLDVAQEVARPVRVVPVDLAVLLQVAQAVDDPGGVQDLTVQVDDVVQGGKPADPHAGPAALLNQGPNGNPEGGAHGIGPPEGRSWGRNSRPIVSRGKEERWKRSQA